MNIECDKNGNAVVEAVFVPAKIVQFAALIRELNDDEFGLMSHLLRNADGTMLARFPKLPGKEKVDGVRYDLLIESYPVQCKIQVIKNVCEMTGLGLYEAKVMSEKLPCVVKSRVSKYEAEKMRSQFEKDCPGIEVVFERSLL